MISFGAPSTCPSALHASASHGGDLRLCLSPPAVFRSGLVGHLEVQQVACSETGSGWGAADEVPTLRVRPITAAVVHSLMPEWL